MEFLDPALRDTLSGGILIGFAASLFLMFNGRVTSVSGIFNGILQYYRGDVGWRMFFIAGILTGGLVLGVSQVELYQNTSGRHMAWVALGGVLIGFGSLMAVGCTTGHLFSGLARRSPRSIRASLIIIASAVLTATGLHYWIGG